MKRLCLALAAALLAGAARAEPRLSSAGKAVSRSAAGPGGGLSTGGGLTLASSVGEVSTGAGSAAGLLSERGLVPLLAQPGTVTSIVAVSKTTGTIELSWTSPGRDGFLGDVVSGFYRVDSSSDPAHVFDASVFVAEFSTDTAPGAAQSYLLSGLQPDTTYYSRVYLADARKAVAETSAPSAESSLARLPGAPAFSGVYATSAAITWTLPAGGAAGYSLDASTTGFAGGTAVSSRTANGVTVTLTIPGLLPQTQYWFNLASLNWQGQPSFVSVLSTRTLGGVVPPVQALTMSADNLNRRVLLSWVNPVFANPAGVTVLVSTNPISASPASGTAYPEGAVLADGSVVRSTMAASSYLETSLPLDVTGYFSLYSRDASDTYSVAVTTSIVLDLPPMAPAALCGALSAGGTSYTLNWAPVASHLDGAGFAGATPTGWELSDYDVYRATSVAAANWVWIGSASVQSPRFAADVPVPGAVYYFRVVSRDGFTSGQADNAMVIDTLDGVWALGSDGVTRFQIPKEMTGFLQPSGNPAGKPLLVRAEERPQDVGGRIVKSVRFQAVTAPDNQPVSLPPATASAFAVSLRYETEGGLVVPDRAARAAAGAAAAPAGPDALAMYYVSGDKAAKLYGHVDPQTQQVSVRSSLLGDYQLRAVARDSSFSMDAGGVSNRAVTPNGDGLNDTVVFTFDNPKDSEVTGKVFDLRGRFVADLQPGPVAGSSLMWDAKAGGAVVPGGVYLYQIRADGKTFGGTVVVIR